MAPLLLLLLLLVPERLGRYPKVGALVVGTGMGWVPLLLVPEQLGGYHKDGLVPTKLLLSCWYRSSGVGALLGAFLKEKPKLLKF